MPQLTKIVYDKLRNTFEPPLLVRGSQFKQLRFFTIYPSFKVDIAIFYAVVLETEIFQTHTFFIFYNYLSFLKGKALYFTNLKPPFH